MITNLEICIESCFGIDAAVEGGADRIELCSSLKYGGLTPSLDVLKLASECDIPSRSMIRPRKGNFIYSSEELKQMQGDIDMVRSFNIEGVVFGATLPNGNLDQDLLEELISNSNNLKKTLHRAVDTMHKTIESVQVGIELGFDTILSSGGEKSALEGLSVLSDMQLLASGKIQVMPGSGVNSITAKKILNSHHFDWIHSSCSINKNADRYTDVESIKSLKNAIS
jgi:copper homeostasis protein